MPDVANSADLKNNTGHLDHLDINSSKMHLPAFLPTIQAKTTPHKGSPECQKLAVKRYLKENDLGNYGQLSKASHYTMHRLDGTKT